MSHLLYWTALLMLLTGDVSGDGKKEKKIKIKIVEAPALNRFPAMPSSNEKVPKRRADPSPLSGPPHLQTLQDKCFSNSYKGYQYKACLFNNITQKEERSGWNRFHGVLGVYVDKLVFYSYGSKVEFYKYYLSEVWHEWIVENDTFVGMHYTVGDHCGSNNRDAKLMFSCSVKTFLHNFTEPHTCSYHMILDTPLACFPGAMQVYHVLSSAQLKEWEELDRLYYSEELTYKGLTRRRKDILIEAGLVHKEKKPLAASTTPPVHHAQATPSPTELAKCHENVKKMDHMYLSVKNQTLKVVENYPDLYNKISAVFFLHRDLDSVLPMQRMTGIPSTSATTSNEARGVGNHGQQPGGIAHSEVPQTSKSPEVKEPPESHDRDAADVANDRAVDGGQKEGGDDVLVDGELENLIEERELDDLMAEFGDENERQRDNAVGDPDAENRHEDRDIDKDIENLDLDGLV